MFRAERVRIAAVVLSALSCVGGCLQLNPDFQAGGDQTDGDTSSTSTTADTAAEESDSVSRGSDGSDDDGTSNTSGPGSSDDCTPCPCSFPSESGLLAEWWADDSLANELPCSTWQLETMGDVPYGEGQHGKAWQFRSTTVDGDDPNYLLATQSEGTVLAQITVDVWIQQTHFNDYVGSNRMLVDTGIWIDHESPTGYAFYLHENGSYYFLVQADPRLRQGRDYDSCAFWSGTEPPRFEWTRLTGTYDGSEIRCYMNGELHDLRAFSTGMVELSIGSLLIGKNYPGDIDAVRIFNRALDADELRVPWP